MAKFGFPWLAYFAVDMPLKCALWDIVKQLQLFLKNVSSL